MTGRLSRQKLASYCAERLSVDDWSCIEKLAAHLLDTRRVDELELIARDIEALLAERGTVIADVYTVETISKMTRKEIADFLQRAYEANQVLMREHIEPMAIGGVRIQTPDARLDATIRTRLEKLKLRGM